MIALPTKALPFPAGLFVSVRMIDNSKERPSDRPATLRERLICCGSRKKPDNLQIDGNWSQWYYIERISF